jgi:hypothetical protein
MLSSIPFPTIYTAQIFAIGLNKRLRYKEHKNHYCPVFFCGLAAESTTAAYMTSIYDQILISYSELNKIY